MDAWLVLQEQGQRILKNGSALATDQENIAELTEQAETFSKRLLPLLVGLGVVVGSVESQG
jgi:hypothetical protein